jgi:hypothetical protein
MAAPHLLKKIQVINFCMPNMCRFIPAWNRTFNLLFISLTTAKPAVYVIMVPCHAIRANFFGELLRMSVCVSGCIGMTLGCA